MTPSRTETPPIDDRQITELLSAWREGDHQAAEPLLDQVYDEIRHIAAHAAALEPAGFSLQATELVHEAFLRLNAGRQPEWRSRKHFYVVAAVVIRRVVIDHARRKQASKRDRRLLDPDRTGVQSEMKDSSVIELAGPLEELAQLDPLAARVIDLRYFVGLTVNETAAVLGISRSTVSRKWRSSRAWLHGRLSDAGVLPPG